VFELSSLCENLFPYGSSVSLWHCDACEGLFWAAAYVVHTQYIAKLMSDMAPARYWTAKDIGRGVL
jgi:ribosomal protein L37AE/L43A